MKDFGYNGDAGKGERMEDTEILDLFFERNENAIKETELKYGERLFSVSRNITGNRTDAEECVNDTYLAAWNQIPPTRPDNYFAFLCRIVRNVSYNLFHKNTALKRNGDVISIDDELSEIIPDPSPADSDETGLGCAIDRFLRSQDKSARYLFVRRYFYGDSISALSKLTGLAETTVAMRLMRIRKKLKAYLEKENFTI